jgi:hypothetical protein
MTFMRPSRHGKHGSSIAPAPETGVYACNGKLTEFTVNTVNSVNCLDKPLALFGSVYFEPPV